MIVVDIGCMEQGPEESVQRLINRFHPDILFGFDPYPDLAEGVERVDSTIVVRTRAAAWTHTGTIPIRIKGICTGVAVNHIRPYENTVEMPCFDLCAFLAPLGEGVVLKLDCEGAEYPLLAAIVAADLDLRLELVLVEWHDGVYAHGLMTKRPRLRCPVEVWERPERPNMYHPLGPTSAVLGSRV